MRRSDPRAARAPRPPAATSPASVIPARCSVSAVARMMKNIAALEKNVPMAMSISSRRDLVRLRADAIRDAAATLAPSPLRLPATPARKRDTARSSCRGWRRAWPSAADSRHARNEGVVGDDGPIGSHVQRRDDVGDEREREPLEAGARTAYRSRIVAAAMPTPSTTTQTCEFTPVSSSAASAMPDRSAPTLIVFATNSATAAMNSTGRGNLFRSAPAMPWPVTMPIRAHIVCTAIISGQVKSAVHRSAVPYCAPATE